MLSFKDSFMNRQTAFDTESSCSSSCVRNQQGVLIKRREESRTRGFLKCSLLLIRVQSKHHSMLPACNQGSDTHRVSPSQQGRRLVTNGSTANGTIQLAHVECDHHKVQPITQEFLQQASNAQCFPLAVLLGGGLNYVCLQLETFEKKTSLRLKLSANPLTLITPQFCFQLSQRFHCVEKIFLSLLFSAEGERFFFSPCSQEDRIFSESH